MSKSWEQHPFKALNLAGPCPGSRLLLLLLPPSRAHGQQGWTHSSQGLVRVRVLWGQW